MSHQFITGVDEPHPDWTDGWGWQCGCCGEFYPSEHRAERCCDGHPGKRELEERGQQRIEGL